MSNAVSLPTPGRFVFAEYREKSPGKPAKILNVTAVLIQERGGPRCFWKILKLNNAHSANMVSRNAETDPEKAPIKNWVYVDESLIAEKVKSARISETGRPPVTPKKSG